MLYRGLTILRAATHETELGDHDFCLSRSHYTDTDPTSRERANTEGIKPGTSSPGLYRLSYRAPQIRQRPSNKGNQPILYKPKPYLSGTSMLRNMTLCIFLRRINVQELVLSTVFLRIFFFLLLLLPFCQFALSFYVLL